MYAVHVYVCGPREKTPRNIDVCEEREGALAQSGLEVATVWKAGLQFLASVIFFSVIMYTMYMEPIHI